MKLLAITVLSLFGVALFALQPARIQAAPSGLSKTEVCNGDRADVTFRWSGVSSDAVVLYLDLTIFDNGWQSGTFLTSGAVTPDQTSFMWPSLVTRTRHLVRVN